ncbi:MAG: Xaa-Pro aminopeptidase [Gammaproteobacteria bacterium]
MMDEYKKRRKKLMQIMGSNSIAILPAPLTQYRNRDVEYPYRPDSDFYYLTGFSEPDSVAVLVPDRQQAQYLLFCNERDPKVEIWSGPRAGQEGACEVFGADDAFPIADIDDILPGLLEDKETVYYTMGCNTEFDHKLMEWVNQVKQKSRVGVHAPVEFVALDHHVHEMRLYKSKHEIKLMKKAASISAEAHKRAMRICQPGMMEYQIESELVHEFMQHGCKSPAYPSIVGGGKNACVLHYIANDQPLNDGDLLLIDAGVENKGYASDITRTFPVNGKFTDAQKAIYEIVLAAQKAAIDEVKPGNHWNDAHEVAVKVIVKGLIKLGILKGTVRSVIKDESYRRFYAHRTGHWLGMDVHDVGDYKVGGVWRLLEPGMVLTVEPGIYIPAGTKGVAKKWWDIGVRIEDDVLVTRDGHEILSKNVPKSVDEIEALMAH